MAVLSMSKREFSRLDVLLRVQSGRLRVSDACVLIGLQRHQVQRRRSLSAPAAVWYRSSAVLASSFTMMAETEPGTSCNRSQGGTGCLAMWQCTHSIGSAAVKSKPPVGIW